MSMIFAHAPLMMPVTLRTPVRYTPWLYAPLALLHASLILRLGFGLGDAVLRRWGGALTVVAIAWFAATLVTAARHRARRG